MRKNGMCSSALSLHIYVVKFFLVEHLIQHAHIYSLGSFQVKPKQASCRSTLTHSQPPSAGSRGVEFPLFAVSFLFPTKAKLFFCSTFRMFDLYFDRKTFHFAILKSLGTIHILGLWGSSIQITKHESCKYCLKC